MNIVINSPLISVIMPVYNSEDYVGEAIASILNQTYTNFEFLIFDDCSTDNSVLIIKSFDDPRIKLITKPKNTGYTRSLNMGLELAKGRYIARMDSDDISLPTRFEKQVDFLEKSPSIVVCGSNYKIHNTAIVSNHPTDPEELKIQLMSGCYLAHPTVIIRTEVFKKNNISYKVEFEPAEDYYLWAELIKFGQIANINEPLLQYRVHSAQVSSTKVTLQIKYADQAKLLILSYLIPDCIIEEKEMFISLIKTELNKEVNVYELKQFVKKMISNNMLIAFFSESKFNHFISAKYKDYVKQYFIYRGNYNIKFLMEFINNYDRSIKIFTPVEKLKFVLKCIFPIK